MVKGLYTASEGMKANMRKQEIVSNNMANVNTTGFKQSALFTRAYTDVVRNDMNQLFVNDQHMIDEVAIDFRPGPMVATQNPLDVAIEGDAFFTVIRQDKSVAYTRSGAFTRDADGNLATLNGEKVMGDTDKPIEVQGKSIHISNDGQVIEDGRAVARLKMAEFREPRFLVKSGNNLYEKSDKTEEVATTGYRIRQGHLEGSNVNPVETMVRMIAGFRNYESDDKALKACDETLGKAVNEVGRIR